MSGSIRTVFGITCLGRVLFVILLPTICHCAISATGEREASDFSACRPLYQGLSDEPMREALDPEAVEVGRLKLCGASPSCNSCLEMRPGDCGYVFPSNVLVYPRKQKGYEEICACTVFACSLPWDPAGWNKKCMGELGCYRKPLFHGIGEFPAALCSGDSSNYVKFGPMAFSLQSYSKPGVVAYEYKKHELVQTLYVYPSKISREYLTDVVGRSRATSTSSSVGDGIQSWTPTKVADGENSLDLSDGTQTHYFAYRRSDLLCIRDYGKSKESTGAFVESCFPMPGLDLPVWYAMPTDPYDPIERIDLQRTLFSTKQYREVKGKNREIKFAKMAQRPISRELKRAENIIDAFEAKMSSSTQYAVRVGLRMDFNEPGGEIREFVSRAGIAPCNVEYVDVEGRVSFECKPSVTGIRAFRGFPARGLLSSYTKRPYYGIVDFDPLDVGICRFANKHNDSERNGQRQCEYVDYCVVREVGRDVVEGIRGRGNVFCVPKSVASDDREFEVLQRAQCRKNSGENGAGEQESLCTERIRVKKKPKMLRRYILVGNGGAQKRIRCDDKYDIDLRTLGQDVLDKAKITGNKFKFSSEYLSGIAYTATGGDPCGNAEYDLVYFYEDGGFVTDVDLRECGNPVEEYYAPGRSISGCEYNYVRVDNYKPYLSSAKGRGSNLSIVPLSRYEQGLCVDDFRSTWFVPSYKGPDVGGGVASDAGDIFYRWDKCEVEIGGVGSIPSVGSTSNEVRKVYRYPIADTEDSNGYAEKASDKDFLFGKDLGCTLYRVEMWGGGQAAVMDVESNKSRSGRPGQYTMLVLDFKSLEEVYVSELQRQLRKSSSFLLNPSKHKYSLVMDIGEGGVPQQKKGRGGDTVLHLCVGSGAQNVPHNESCHEIARAVGGGSEKADKSPALTKFLRYYSTIIGDVLASDRASSSLLLSHNAMFTKFPLTMNIKVPASSTRDQLQQRREMKDILSNRSYFDGRSAPSQFCEYKGERASKAKVFVPGMGGCWSKPNSASGGSSTEKPEPGVGENGAVMITCERWGKKNLQAPAMLRGS